MNANEKYYRKPIGAIGGGMLIFLLLLNLFGIAISLIPSLLSLLRVDTVPSTVIYQLIYAAGYLFSFMMPVLFIKLWIKKAGYPYAPMYASLKISGYIPLILFAGVTLIFAFASINAQLVSIFDYSAFSSDILWDEGAKSEPYELILQFITICVVPGFCEEFLFRGSILTNCLPFGRSNAILISALLFGLMHQNAEQILYAFAAGILLGIVYERTGSIWNCTVLHIFNNFMSLIGGVVIEKWGTGWLGYLGYTLFETAIFVLGMISLTVLIIRFFSQKKSFRDGFFGKELPASDDYATHPIAADRARKLFLTPTMVLFFVFCILQILMLIGLAVLYNGISGI